MQLTTEGTYNDTVKNQLNCDSVIYILNLKYLPDVVHIEEDTLLCHGATCEWRNMQLTTEGTYKDTVKNQLNCDSLIYILNLEYLPDVVFVEEDTLLCYGATCEWRDMQLITAGTYKDTIKNQLNCDSLIYILNLSYLPDVEFIEEDTLLCHGITCNWRGLEFESAGTYNDTVKNQLDCDSVIYILNLEYLPDVVFVEEDTLLCYGATCEWRDLQLTTAGTYKDTVKNQLDCDSIIYILNLEYLPDVVFIEEDTLLCYGVTCEWRGLQLTTADTYNDTVKNQLNCDSLIYILNLKYLLDVQYIEEDTLLCHGVTCEWRGLELDTAGTYNDTVKNQLDCDSVIYILNLEYLPDVVFVEEDTLLCYGATCEWRNMQLTTADTYKDTIKNQLDCDSLIYILNLKYLPDVQYIEEDTLLCHGVTCEWRTMQLTTEGTYKDTVKNQLDCDSVIYILNIEYLPDVVFVEEDTLLCYGTTCEWRDLQLTTAGTYKDTVKNQLNGDSIIYILNLEYLPDVVFVEEDTLLCYGATCEWRNMQLTTADTYKDTIKNQLDCDSLIYILNLKYLPDVQYIEEDTLLCHGVTCEWRTMQLTTEGTYKDTVKNQLDCDSVIYILNIEYLPDVVFIEEDTLLCYGVTCEWRNLQLTTAGTYKDTIKNQLDCDSVIYTLNLKYLPDVVFVEEDTLLCYGATCEWRNMQLTTANTYKDTVKNQLDCDSVIYILNLKYLPDVEYIEEDTLLCHGVTCNWRGLEFESAGTYNDTVKNQLDCDSVIYILNLEYLPDVVFIEEDTLLCYGVTCEWRGLELDTAGTYNDTVKNQLDCDSVIYILNLEYLPDVEYIEEDTLLCYGITCNWRGLEFDSAGTYKDTIKNQLDCDSVIYILNLEYLPDVVFVEEDTLLCHGVTCEWRNKQLTTAGTYNDTVKNQLDCDSVIYILNLEYLPDVEFIEEDTLLCHGVTCEWRGLELESAGTYNDTVKNQLNCDSVIYILNLAYLPDVVFVEEDTLLCHGVTCEWRNMQLTTAGTYNDTVKNQLDCDSVIYILNLAYLPDVEYIEEDTLLCHGVTCEWRNLQLTTAGTYKDTIKNQLDCDSVIYILHLEYLPDVEYIEEDTLLCHGVNCEWRNMLLTTEGTYNDTVKNQLNCDSVIYILNLKYLPDVVHIEEDTLLCHGMTCEWRNMQLATAGTYNDTVKNQLGCDSVIYTLNLTYLPDVEYIEEDTLLCHGITCNWRGLELESAGTYKDTVKNQLNGDSIIYILNLEYLPDVVFVEEDTLLCHEVTCEWRGLQFENAGTYNDTVKNQLDCDSVIYILNLAYLPDVVFIEEDTLLCHGVTCEWRGLQFENAGTYNDTVKNQLGCDSVIYTLNLAYLPDVEYIEEDTLLCYGITCNWRGLEFESAGTYNDTVKNQLHCDSVIYILNLAYLPDVVFIEEDTLLCHGVTCEWRGLQFENAGTYNDTVKNQLGCDSVIYTLNLAYLPDVEYIEEDTLLCYGITCNWRGLEFDTAGTYNDTVKNQLDCDSVIYILNLKYLPDVEYIEKDTLLCYGVTCEWRSLQLNTAGTYKDTVKNQLDCDSVIYILHLEYLPDVVLVEEDTLLCYGVTCEWRGLELESAGTYNDTVKNQLNCDSVIYILNLKYLPDVEYIEEDTLLCHGVTCEWRNMQLTTEGTYKDTVKNQLDCDSVIYILHLEYLPDVVLVEEDTLLCYGVTCEWRGLELESAGTYNDTVKNQLGCDSVIYTLNLAYLPDVEYIEEDTLLCYGVTCEWRGVEFESAGTYNDTVKNQLDCDSVIYILNLEYLPDVEYIEKDTLLCYGVTCNWRGLEFESAGTYNDTVKNQLDCDSVIYILHLEYLPDVEYIEEDTLLCYGVTCEWRGVELESAGTYNDTVKNQLNCDSVIYILHLEYLPDVVLVEEDTLLCYGVTCEWRGLELESAGTYNDTVKNQLDCDSVIYTLNLAYLPDVEYIEEDTLLCYGVTCEWRGLELENAGTYNDTVKNQLDCDSVIYILNLEYLPDVVYVEEDTLLCHGVTCNWRGLELESAGTYNDTVKNQLGCDSVIYILHLEYLPQVQHFITDTFLCYGEVCDWRGTTYTESIINHDTIRNILGCDSLIYTLNLVIHPEIPVTHVIDTMAGAEYHWNDQIYTYGGDYTVILSAITGCDSVVTLHLVDNPSAIDTVIVYEQCAGSGEQDIKILTQGFIEKIELRYSAPAQAAGLRDTVVAFSSTSDTYTIYYDSVRAGVHEATAVGLFHGIEVATYTFALTYLYPNTIFEQRYNDLIAVLTHDYNGGYDFAAFQWYKDGVMLQGETHSYLNQPLTFDSEYSVLLTSSDGLQMMSCPIFAEDKADLSVYPTLIKVGGSVICRMTQPMQLCIYHSSGVMMQEYNLETGKNEIYMPGVSGVYMLLFISNNRIERNVKVIVQ